LHTSAESDSGCRTKGVDTVVMVITLGEIFPGPFLGILAPAMKNAKDAEYYSYHGKFSGNYGSLSEVFQASSEVSESASQFPNDTCYGYHARRQHFRTCEPTEALSWTVHWSR
jgi:hypothetical protein